MPLPPEAPVIKAVTIAIAAKRNNWHGNIDTTVIDGVRHATVQATRNDEAIKVSYVGKAYHRGVYSILGKETNLHCASVAIEKLEGWPDLLDLFKSFPGVSKPSLVEKYRRLPFEHDEEPVDIMSKLYGRQVFWFSHEYNRLDVDVVLAPRNANAKQYRIADVGHRRIFHFIGQKAGFRSVILDTIIKVG